jgi:hypothetical protein
MTTRIGRLMVATAAGILLTLAGPLGVLADSLATVDCGDGSPLSTTADLATLTSLQASIQGMIDDPSGINCTLSEGALVDPTLTIGGNNGGNSFVVGGGRYDRGPAPGSSQGCGVNFSLNAHSDKTGFHGEQTYTVNNADGCGDFGFAGHVKANVTCLDVSGNAAQIKGTVTQVTGFYSSFVSIGDVVESDVVDNGKPSGGNPDLIDNAVYPAGTNTICLADTTHTFFFPVENGNITVHD